MIDALRYEFARIRTIRSTWWLTGLTFVIGVGIALLLAFSFRGEVASADDADLLGPLVVTQLSATGQMPCLVAFLLAIIGVFAWGHEYRHGMIRASLTALNSRTSLWVAKYAVVGVWVVVTAFVTMLVSVLVSGAVVGPQVPLLTGETWQAMGRLLVYVLLLTWLAMAFTSITRSQAFALVTMFLWPLLIESLVVGLFSLVPSLRDHSALTRFLPFRAGARVLDVTSHGSSTFGDPMTFVGGLLVFAGVTVVLMAVALVLFDRRDA